MKIRSGGPRRGRRLLLLQVRLPAVPQPFDDPGVALDDGRQLLFLRRRRRWISAGLVRSARDRHAARSSADPDARASIGVVVVAAAAAHRAHGTVRVAEERRRPVVRVVLHDRPDRKKNKKRRKTQ